MSAASAASGTGSPKGLPGPHSQRSAVSDQRTPGFESSCGCPQARTTTLIPLRGLLPPAGEGKSPCSTILGVPYAGAGKTGRRAFQGGIRSAVQPAADECRGSNRRLGVRKFGPPPSFPCGDFSRQREKENLRAARSWAFRLPAQAREAEGPSWSVFAAQCCQPPTNAWFDASCGCPQVRTTTLIPLRGLLPPAGEGKSPRSMLLGVPPAGAGKK